MLTGPVAMPRRDPHRDDVRARRQVALRSTPIPRRRYRTRSGRSRFRSSRVPAASRVRAAAGRLACPCRSTQLAVLAAAPVVAAGGRALLGVARLLALHAQAYAGHGLAPRLGDPGVALLAVLQPGTLWNLAAHALDRVLDGRVDLVLHCAIACPTGCHVASCFARRVIETTISRPRRTI